MLERFFYTAMSAYWAIRPEVFADLMGSMGSYAGLEIEAATSAGDFPLSDRERAWDVAAADRRIRKWASSDGSGSKTKMDWGKYARAHFWHDNSNGKGFGAYKLPFCDVINGEVTAIWRGVTAAAAAMSGSRGGVNIPASDRGAVKAAIGRYYAKARKKYNDNSISTPWSSAEFEPQARGDMEGSRVGNTAIIPLKGVLAGGGFMSLFFGTPLAQFRAQFARAVNDPNVSSIVMDIDSPGGVVDHIPETAAMVRSARERKPISAVANTDAASAAYWIASQANELYVTPSGAAGSIGVFTAHRDMSGALEKMGIKTTLISAGKYKTEGNPFGPLSKEAKSSIQETIDSIYGQFVDDVAAGRNATAAEVRRGYGEGRMLLANEAVKAHLADGISTLEEVVANTTRKRSMTNRHADRRRFRFL